ncbi:MAG: DUF4249 domain-containing protein [Bacteroidetes bacterium]|nr:DUF4249 domain-containing protein [Bacteroidota bacterium]
MKTLKYLLPCLLGFVFVQCTEKINIKLDNTSPRLVVDGAITTDTTAHKIKLATSTDYFYNQPAPAVTGALVTINDGSSTTILTEKPVGSGSYETPTTFFGIPGKTYSLHIELKEALNGQKIYDATETMPKQLKIDSIQMEFKQDIFKKGAWETKLYAQDPLDENFYCFRGYRNDVLVTDTLDRVTITDDKLFNGRYTNGISVLYWNQNMDWEVIHTGDRIKLQLGSLTKNYFNFIQELQLEVGEKNPLFSGPSANVRTNITNGGIGYFAAYSTCYASTKVKPITTK